ncbi:MAG: GTPase [Chitinophagaceae bacterium]
MNVNCTYRECQEDWLSESPQCLCGETDYRKCRNYVADSPQAVIDATLLIAGEKETGVPWSGSAMGSLDLQWISAVKQPFIIGLVGPPNSGKTTLLATLFLSLRHGKRIGHYQFAGSYTLLGWEKIAHFLSLDGNKKVSFPPHTSANMTRVPGLLHLLLKDSYGRYQDVLFTDAPGEWFHYWAKAADAEASTGARWIDEQADAFLIVADSKAFEQNVGIARHELMQIVERMKNTHRNRPTIVVWTKADVVLNEIVKSRITTSIKNLITNVQTYNVAVINRKSEQDIDNILDLTFALLNAKQDQNNELRPIQIKSEEDFFFLIR